MEVPTTAVVKLLQYSGLRSNTGMGFHPKNGLHQGMKVRLSIWTFWICDSKIVEVSWKLRNCKSWKLKLKKFTLKI